MKYYVYTDGAYSIPTHVAAYAYFIRTEKLFVGIGRGILHTDGIALAEAKAVGEAAEYMISDVALQPSDICIIKTDSQYVFQNFNTALKYGQEAIKFHNDVLINAINSVKKLSEVCTVSLSKVNSHNKEKNGNSYVDRLAKYQLALSKMKE